MTLAESISQLVAQVAKIGGETGGLLQRIVDLEDEVSRLRKLVVPIRWTSFTPSFTNGTAATVNVATYLQNSQNLTVTYSVVGTLPSGCTFAGSTLSYDGAGAAGSTSVVFRAVAGAYTVDTASTVVTINAAPVGNRAPVWTTVPTQNATQGTQFTAGLSGYASDPDGNPLTFGRTGSASDTAPSAITVNSSGLLTVPNTVAAGTYTVEAYADDGVSATPTAQSDWLARSTAAGVTFASDFSGPSDFVLASTNGGRVFAGGMDPATLALVVKDTTDGITNGCCLRIDTPAAKGPNSAAWMFPLNAAWTTEAQSFGSAEFYIQFRFKMPASRLTLSNTGGGQAGWKWMNIAHYSPTATSSRSFSNSACEIVLQDTDQRGLPQAYHQDGNSYPPFNGFAGGQITLQTAIDRGAAYSGGDRYCWYPNGTPACVYFPVDQWMTFMVRIKVGTYGGSAGNEFDMWIATAGATSWTQLFNDRNFALGAVPSGFTGLNGAHLLNYETNRISGVDTWVKYDQVIVSTQPIAIPAV